MALIEKINFEGTEYNIPILSLGSSTSKVDDSEQFSTNDLAAAKRWANTQFINFFGPSTDWINVTDGLQKYYFSILLSGIGAGMAFIKTVSAQGYSRYVVTVKGAEIHNLSVIPRDPATYNPDAH